MNDYNQNWCNERHGKIDTEFENVWSKMKAVDGRVWTVLVMLFMNLIGVFGVLLLLLIQA